MKRAWIGELRAPYGPNDIRTADGEPFEGIVCRFGEEGPLVGESCYRQGCPWGPQRDWHPSGVLTGTHYEIGAQVQGVLRTWHFNGRLEQETLAEYGVPVRWHRWDEDGHFLENGRLEEGSDEHRRLLQNQARSAAEVAAEVLPEEFRSGSVDWDHPPHRVPLPPPGHRFPPPHRPTFGMPPPAVARPGWVAPHELRRGEDTYAGLMLSQGQPVTGVAFRSSTQGVQQVHYRDGLLWGPKRRWFGSGALEYECYFVAGMAHGAFRRWYLSGQAESLGESRYGVCLRRRSWHGDGRGIVDEDFKEGDWRYDLIRRMQDRYGHLVEGELIPDEFRSEPYLG
jgi:antitoxin component YwqK of YwqJK toxin-antitoxin module